MMKYILLVDDEAMNLDILEEILSDDYETKSVENGIECLKSIDERIPDLLLLDFAMPEMDGVEVCKRIRSNEATKDLPVVMLSGFASEEHIEKGNDAGVNEYITKPFYPSQILEVVERYLA